MPARGASTKARKLLREKYGPLPWNCWWCNRSIARSPDTHHLNGDHDDDRPENLVAVHHGCHPVIHTADRKITIDGRRRLSKAAKVTQPWTYPNPGHTGYKHSKESKQKMSHALQGNHKGWKWKLINGKRVWIKPDATSE